MVVQLGSEILVYELLPLLDLHTLLALRLTSSYLKELVENHSLWKGRYHRDFGGDQWAPWAPEETPWKLESVSDCSIARSHSSSVASSWFVRYHRRRRASLVLWDPDQPFQVAQFLLPRGSPHGFRALFGMTTVASTLVAGKLGHIQLMPTASASVPSSDVLRHQLIMQSNHITGGPFVMSGGNSTFLWALDSTGRLHGVHAGSWRQPFVVTFGFEATHPIQEIQGLVVQGKGVLLAHGIGLVVFQADEPPVGEDPSDPLHERPVKWSAIRGTGPGSYLQFHDAANHFDGYSNRASDKLTEVAGFAAGFEFVVYLTLSGEPYFYDVPQAIAEVPGVSPVLLDDALALLPVGARFVKVRAHIASFALVSDQGDLVYYSDWDTEMAPQPPVLVATSVRVRDVTLSTNNPLIFCDDGLRTLAQVNGVWHVSANGIPSPLRETVVRVHAGQNCLVGIALPDIHAADVSVVRRDINPYLLDAAFAPGTGFVAGSAGNEAEASPSLAEVGNPARNGAGQLRYDESPDVHAWNDPTVSSPY